MPAIPHGPARLDVLHDKTRAGRYRGIERDGAVAWLGIRYAHGPRWQLPEPASPPAHEQRCVRLGAASAQPGSPVAAASRCEDALWLNVYSPAADGRARPVLVWLHGGAFVFGSGAHYDGSRLARDGDIVVVTLNYRLGVLGFVDFSAIGAPRNLGLHDQLAALAWVGEHIAEFGGDPESITLAGESAGAMSVASLLAAPSARGRFQRAILQSGSINLMHDADLADTLGRRLLAMLGPYGESLAALRQAPLERLFAAHARLARQSPGVLPGAPVFDGGLLPASLRQALAQPSAPVPLLLGSNHDEVRLFELPGLRTTLPIGRRDLLATLASQLGEAAVARLARVYPDSPAGRNALATDAYFTQPTRRTAERQLRDGRPAWLYRFDCRGLLGAPHAAELAYLWPMRGLPGLVLRGGWRTPARDALGQRMRRHWIEFVRHGQPGGDWPAYSLERRQVRAFDLHDRTLEDPDRDRRLAWGEGELTARTAATGAGG